MGMRQEEEKVCAAASQQANELMGARGAELQPALREALGWVQTSLTTPASGTAQIYQLKAEDLVVLNDVLRENAFVCGTMEAGAIDEVLFLASYEAVSNLNTAKRFELCHAIRWFDQMQHLPSMKQPLLQIDLVAPMAKAQKQGKNKKEKKPKKEKIQAKTSDVSKLHIVVGRLSNVRRHPDADHLYVEDVDIGESAPRQVVSGLANHLTLEQMEGRLVCLLLNVAKGDLKGVESNGVVLCASTDTVTEPLQPPPTSQPGDLVTFPGVEGAPDAVLKPKKLHKVLKSLVSASSGSPIEALGDGIPFSTKHGVVTVPTLFGARIK